LIENCSLGSLLWVASANVIVRVPVSCWRRRSGGLGNAVGSGIWFVTFGPLETTVASFCAG
jgi:hypothetical protein